MILAVSLITFALLSSAGGDAFSNLRENPQISEQTIEELRRVYGFDQPFIQRFGFWLGRAVRGDLGESFSLRSPVATVVWQRFLNTLLLGVSALIIAILISSMLAVASVLYPRRVLLWTIEALILFASSTPRIVLALLALVVSLRLALPVSTGGIGGYQFVAGAIVLAIPMFAIFLAQLRDGLASAMAEDFVLYARAKGLSEWAVVWRHASRAAIHPFLTVAGFSIGGLLGGSVIVETVLGWPGIGALTVAAVRGRDVPLVMGVVLVTSIAVWLGNSAAELLQLLNDKRLRSGGFD